MRMILLTHLLILFVICTNFGSLQQGEEVCPNGWLELAGNNGKLCYMYYNRKLSWEDGKKFCESAGATMPIVKYPEEAEFIYRTAGEEGQVWLGLSDREVEGTWKWVDDTLYDSNADGIKWPDGTQWDKEPNGGTGENCAQLFSSSIMVDNSCFYNSKVVCQRKAGNVTEAKGDETIGSGCSEDAAYFDTVDGRVCYKWTGAKMNWKQGKEHCESEGSTLPILKSTSEKHFLWLLDIVSGYFKRGHFSPVEVWLGLTDKTETGFAWLDGTPFTSNTSINDLEWKKGNPNGGSGEQCGELNNDLELVDNDCNRAKSIICQTKGCPKLRCIAKFDCCNDNRYDVDHRRMYPDQPTPTVDNEPECGLRSSSSFLTETADLSTDFKTLTLKQFLPADSLFTFSYWRKHTIIFECLPINVTNFTLVSSTYVSQYGNETIGTSFSSNSIEMHVPDLYAVTVGKVGYEATFSITY